MALQPWQKCTVIDIKDETPDTRRFSIRIDGVDRFDFVPGQFVTLDLPIHEKSNKRWRSYSIASAPDGTNIIELIIVLNPEGLGTPYLFNQVKPGSELIIRGPQGVFTLPQSIEKDIYFICTGTGIAPFRSMLLNILNQNIPHKRLFLIYGCRRKNNLMYFDEMNSLQQQLEGFTYIPTLSREEWEGKSGYVHDVYEQLLNEKSPSTFFLCGWREMIDEARSRIQQIGYDRKDIHVELYG